MAVLYITEFRPISKDANNAFPTHLASWPPIAEQTVAIGGASAQSAALNNQTGLVRIQADAICSIAIGTNPTATATNMRIPANAPGEYILVPPGGNWKIAVITNT